jgi:hypothetical protein
MRCLALRCGITTDMGMIHKWVAFFFLYMFFLPSTPPNRLEDGGFHTSTDVWIAGSDF